MLKNNAKFLATLSKRYPPKPLAVMVAALSVGMSSTVIAQQVEEVIVTATKRAESTQEIPMAISVLGQETLGNLNITDLEDYVTMLPNVSYIGLGPGSGNVYIRGISSGGESSLGANPSVAVYLDDQPVTATGAYLNPHIYDVQRIEVLAGPQGTLFGANAQSGAMRIITNQPDPTGFSAGINLDVSVPKSGDVGETVEGFINIPISDTAALRVVGFSKREGGFIDNVKGEHTFKHGFIRDGLIAGGATEAQAQAMAPDFTYKNYTDGDIGNVAEENFNEATTIGFRAALAVDLNDSWTATASVMHQDLESQGVWDHDPTIGDLQVMRLLPDSLDDEWTQYSLKVEGDVAGGTLTFNYGDLDRDYEVDADYSLYSDYYVSGGYVQPYYSCYAASYGCSDPRTLYEDHANYQRETMEIRYASDPSKPLRWQAGYYSVDVKNRDDAEWHVLGLADLGMVTAIDAPDIYWTTDFRRSYEEEAIFAEITYDFDETLSISMSMRHFDSESYLDGFSGTVWWPCGGGPSAAAQEASGEYRPTNNYGADCADSNRITASKDEVYRFTAEWNATDDIMLYAAWGEGYRPGGLNRFCSVGNEADYGGQGRDDATGAKCDFVPDFLTSQEVGLKATLFDGRMLFNAAAFMQDWDDFQFSRLDTSISPVTLTYNIGQAQSDGLELDFNAMISENWSLTGGFSYIEAELSEDYFQSSGLEAPTAAKGTALPRVPETKWNLSSRYTLDSGWYMQASYIYTGESYNNLYDGGTVPTKRYKQKDYQILNAAVGLDLDTWRAEMYVRNLTDERGEVYRNAVNWDDRIMTNRPRTLGVSMSMKF
jgi:outer membrane receptor protein involved in Fe transport